MFGAGDYFQVGDVPAVTKNVAIASLTGVKTDTTSPEIGAGANSIQIGVTFSDALTTCSIDVISWATGSANTVKTFTGVNYLNSGIYTDGAQIALAGAPIQLRAYNFTGNGTATVTYTPMN
jgi:hypothetical protein